jgi:lipopolysaccharide/colanic/teichoic acid biosynthesis glycosyltransferase
MLVCAIGVRLSSPGPVIFRQERVGRDKKPFHMYKFRSMRVNAKQDTCWSTDHDDRKTQFGSFLRKCSLDEFPQFFNVFKGDMSLVGPRPEVPFYVDRFKEEVPRYMVKHQVRPGITGWAQVHGFRGDTSIKGRIEHDIYYIEHWSILLDIKILLMTVFGGKFLNEEKLN